MKRKTLLKSTLCLLMALVCNVAWAESVMPKISDAPADGQWAANTTWYQIKTGGGNYLRSNVTDNDGNLQLTNTNSTVNDESLWCIVGNAENGYAFYNKAKGATLLLGMTGADAGARASFVALDNTDKTKAFDFTASAKNEHWCVKEHGSVKNYWNKRGNYLAYWNDEQAVWGWGGNQANPTGGDNGSALLFMEVVPLTYLLTDAVGNTFEGEYEGVAGTTEPSFAGVVGCTFVNKVWNGTHFTATINFPFPVSKSGEENWTFIKSFPMNNVECYFHVDNEYNKVITRSSVAANGMTYLPTVGNIAKWQWAIYPAFADGKFTFTIKNRAANKFVGGTSGTSTVNPTPLAAEDAAGVFCWGACIGSGNGFYLANNTDMFFAANSSAQGDQNTILWPKSGSTHQGANLRFPEASYTVATDGNGYAAVYTPMAVTIPNDVTAYMGRLNADNSVLFLEKVSTAIPANTAVILKGAASTTYVFAESSVAVAAIDGNVLQGAETSVEVSAIEGSAYTFQASNAAFTKVTEGTIPAYSVYVASQGGANVISIDDTRAEAISHVVANASKLGQDFGRAYYVANGTKLYTADDARAAIYAAADADAANEIVGSFKYNIPVAGTPYYLMDNHGTYLDIHHLGADGNGYEHELATMSATKQLLYITGDDADGTWKIHTTAEGGNYLHQSSDYGWNSKVSSDGGNFKWEVEGVEIEGVLHYMLKHNSGTQNGYLGAENHTAGNALYVDQNEAAKKLKMQLIPLPAAGYYHMSSRDVSRHEHLYNNALHSGNATKRLTLQSDTRIATNNGIWHISYNADGSMAIKNGDGNAIVPGNSSAEATGRYNALNIEKVTYVDAIPYYSFTQALNCSKSGYSLNGINILTTWAGHPDAADNQWRFDPVSVEGKTIYEVVVDGDANAYVAYDNGTTVQNAFNGGFFIADAPITEAQLSAGFAGSVVKSATITIDDEKKEITVADVVTFVEPVKIDLYNTSNGSLGVPPYRIPGITVDPETGRIITTAARLVCGTDPGYGQVDVVCRYSDDNGENWSEMKDVAVGTGVTSPTENYFDTAFGDPAVVADRTSNEVLIIVVAGCTKYQTASRAIPNMIGTIHSKDNGESWGTPVDVTEDIYSLFDAENGGNYMDAAFVGGGKIFQSRIVKVGKYYRLYAAMCARPNGNRVIYSDDFGRTWLPLGGPAALPAPGGDEPKCEEMPDGRVILSSRVGGGRIYNIYTYSNTATAEGSWGTSVTSTFEGSGKTHNGQSTNGEILIVPVVRNSDGKEMYLALQSLPTGGGRTNVGIFYKELTDLTDINTVANFAIDWNGFYQVSYTTSAYSSMDLQNDGRIGFIYEENYTKHGSVSNPHSIPFPDADNLGTHNYDGYDNIYVAYELEYITNKAYSIKRDVNRHDFVSNYFTELTADVVDEVKDAVATSIAALSAEPTITEVDGIYFNIGKGDAITAVNTNKGKVGYYLDAAVDTYKEEVIAAETREALAAAEAKLATTTEWNKPVSGKAYTFKNVQKDGTTMRWYKYDGEKIVLTANESEATPFVCRLLDNGKYVFVSNEGKYMTWRGSDSGNTGIRGEYDATTAAYTDVRIEKMTTGNNISGNLSNTRYINIYARRNANGDGCVVIAKSGPAFDKSDAPYYNDNHSSAILMEEATFGNAPKVNGVGESTLMSEDLHGKHMSTFSATYATVAPEGVTAYYATKAGDKVALYAIAEDEAIPAGTGVILVSEEGGNAVMLPAAGETAANVAGNLLVGTAGAAKNMTGIANAYLLTGGAQGAGFYLCSGGTLAAGKAYLQLENAQQAVRIRLAGATGVENAVLEAQGSQLIYDLTGRRVEKMEKGIYIVNGKKVVVK